MRTALLILADTQNQLSSINDRLVSEMGKFDWNLPENPDSFIPVFKYSKEANEKHEVWDSGIKKLLRPSVNIAGFDNEGNSYVLETFPAGVIDESFAQKIIRALVNLTGTELVIDKEGRAFAKNTDGSKANKTGNGNTIFVITGRGKDTSFGFNPFFGAQNNSMKGLLLPLGILIALYFAFKNKR